MAIQAPFLLCLLALAGLLASGQGATPSHHYAPFNRSSFPHGFIFGAGSAAYQSEGAASLEGRGPSIWDVFTKKHSEKISDQKNGDVADDLYHRYKEDVKLIKKVGLDSFRFSISWSRILPKGKISGGVNPLGVKYYNNFINELIAEGITPFVTLFHLDLPQALEEEYGGFLSPKIVKDYVDYVDFCFKTFGDRVKHWVTMNEPNGLCINGYNGGSFAPGRCSKHEGNCTAGNSATEPYIVAHHLLLSHASAVKLYKDKYQAHQKGIIGITIVTHWFIPRTPSASSQSAASRTLDFMFNWFVNPVIYGEYPQSMRATVGNRLPKFTAAESKLLKGSLDFLGINYYTTYYAESAAPSNGVNLSYVGDRQSTFTSFNIRGAPIGTPTALSWLYIYPKGLRDLLIYIKEKYNNPIVYVNENGMADANNILDMDKYGHLSHKG